MNDASSEHGALPLLPIDRPPNLLSRALYAATRRRYGVTPTAFRVVYARSLPIALVSVAITMALDLGLSLDPGLRFLLQVAGATRAGCTFCADLNLAEATRRRLGAGRFADLDDFEGSAAFTPREKAALAYVAAVHRSLRVDDAVWSRLKEHFTEREQLEVVWLCAVERYFNAMALPLRIGSDGLAGRVGAGA